MTFHEDFPELMEYYPLGFKDYSPELKSFLELHFDALDWKYDEKNHNYNYNFLAFYFLYMLILFSYNYKKNYCELNYENRKDKNIYKEYEKETEAFNIFPRIRTSNKIIKDNIMKPRTDFAHPNFLLLDYEEFNEKIKSNLNAFEFLLEITKNPIIKCFETFLHDFNVENELELEIETYLLKEFYLSPKDLEVIVDYLFEKILSNNEKIIFNYLQKNYITKYNVIYIEITLHKYKHDSSLFNYIETKLLDENEHIIEENETECFIHTENPNWLNELKVRTMDSLKNTNYYLEDLDENNIKVLNENGNDFEEIIY